MTKNANYVSHKKSKLKENGGPKLPLASALVEGEIAINFGKDVETLSIKNESGDVVTFSSDNYYTEKKLGSGFTGANSAVTVTDVIEENEEIIAAALTDIDERKLDASAYTELWEASTGENSVVLKNSNNVASGISSVAEGSGTTAGGNYSHAEGNQTYASGNSSHAEGAYTIANASYSHAEGISSRANGLYSHAEGNATIATASGTHTEGSSTSATSADAHAEGYKTLASGENSHAEGYETNANNYSEHASGQYNISRSASTRFGDSGNTLFSVGNGTADNARHNAFEIRQNGDIYIVDNNGNDIKLQDNLGGGGSITVDKVLDDTTSASTNPVSSKAVYKAVTDNELVWTNTYVTLSGTVSSHTENTEIHVTAADKEKLHTHSNKTALDTITGNVGTMAYENKASYYTKSETSGATEISTALGKKSNTGHRHTSNDITKMTNYTSGSTNTPIQTNDTLNQAIGKLEHSLGGINLIALTQQEYDNLATKYPTTLYIITDN